MGERLEQATAHRELFAELLRDAKAAAERDSRGVAAPRFQHNMFGNRRRKRQQNTHSTDWME